MWRFVTSYLQNAVCVIPVSSNLALIKSSNPSLLVSWVCISCVLFICGISSLFCNFSWSSAFIFFVFGFSLKQFAICLMPGNLRKKFLIMLTITSYVVLLIGALGFTLGLYLSLLKVVKLI